MSFPGSGGAVTLTHDSLSRRTGIDRPGAAADTAYTYEPDSDLASISHAFVAGSGPGAVSFAYGHDATGKTTSIGISQPAFEWMPSLSYARSYGVANELNQIGSAGGIGIGWNADGNMTSDGVNTYSWGYGNRMVGASRKGMTAAYDYDSDDRRTKKTVNGVVTRTMWSGADELAEYDGNGDLIRRFVPDGTGAMDARLATVTAAGAVYWHHVDHQGTVIATSDSAGQTVGTASYSPYGEFGAGISAPPQHSPFGYTGRQYDVETGLYQYRARYYSPRLGQFLSMDPIGTKDDPNLYMYVGLDPVNKTDPTGKDAVVLNGEFNPLLGLDHQAILIGSDATGWRYISKDGSPWGAVGPSKYTDTFYRMPLAQILARPEIASRYDTAYRTTTTRQQDALMADAGARDARTLYHVLSQNCADTVQRALAAAGIPMRNSINPAETRPYLGDSPAIWRFVPMPGQRVEVRRNADGTEKRVVHTAGSRIKRTLKESP